MTEDADFVRLGEKSGAHPTCGNTSNARLKEILKRSWDGRWNGSKKVSL